MARLRLSSEELALVLEALNLRIHTTTEHADELEVTDHLERARALRRKLDSLHVLRDRLARVERGDRHAE